jgi:hypothetical protein
VIDERREIGQRSRAAGGDRGADSGHLFDRLVSGKRAIARKAAGAPGHRGTDGNGHGGDREA